MPPRSSPRRAKQVGFCCRLKCGQEKAGRSGLPIETHGRGVLATFAAEEDRQGGGGGGER